MTCLECVKIESIVPCSIAERHGIQPGSTICSINGQPVRDALDLVFYENAVKLTIHGRDPEGSMAVWNIRKRQYTSLGIITEPIPCSRCRNHCIFCFVDQNPCGMREAVYFKDEDYRYSFLSGHYVTLAHLSDRDLARIVAQRIQPLYVSIHCTDEKIRRSLLGIRKSRPILELMHRLKDAGILMQGQIVLCPGINDGSVLEKTIGDLLHLRPELGSVSLIPVGLTDHRDGLPFLQTPTMAWARQIIRIRNRYSLKDDPGWLMCSDEFYLKAQVALPSYREYGGFHQIGNGVGLTRDFVHHAHRIRKKWRPVQFPPGRRFIITGISSSLMMKAVVGYWTRGVPWHHIKIIEVENKFFGSCVTVSGLMAGRDILTSLASAMPFQSSDRILIPSVCLAPDNSSFIDNMTVDELQNRAGIAVDIIAPDPESLYDGLFSRNNFV